MMPAHCRLFPAAIFLAAAALSANAAAQSGSDTSADDVATAAVSPEAAVRRFMAALAEGDGDAIEKAILPHPEAVVLFRIKKGRPLDPDQLAELPLKRLNRGDTVKIPGGKSLILDESHVNGQRAQIMAPGAPLPFIVVLVNSDWLVNAAPIISARQAAARARKAAGTSAPWVNDSAALATLAAEVAVGEYSLCPPSGFKLTHAGPQTWRWVGNTHDQNRIPELIVMTTDLTESEIPKSLDDALADALTGVENLHIEWQVSKMERGDIGNLQFVRAFWGGVRNPDRPEPTRGQKTHGFIYLTIDGSRAVTIIFRDAEPQFRDNIKSCQSAVLTWRKRKAE